MSSTTEETTTTDAAAIETGAKTTTQMITLKTSDGVKFRVEEKVAMELGALRKLFEDNEEEETEQSDYRKTVIPLPNVVSETLTKVLEFVNKTLEFRRDLAASDADSKLSIEKAKMSYESGFVKSMDAALLIDLMLAANYLDVKPLLDMAILGVADRIKDKSVEYVREFFGIENDYTPEEEAQLRDATPWAFEGVE